MLSLESTTNLDEFKAELLTRLESGDNTITVYDVLVLVQVFEHELAGKADKRRED